MPSSPVSESTGTPRPAEDVQGIGPLFTPPYVYLMFPVVVAGAAVLFPLLPVGGGGGPFVMLQPMLVLFALALLGAVGTLWPMHLRIGNDGVLIRWFRLQRYIPYRDLAAVEVHRSARSRGLLFVTRKGRRFAVPLQMHVMSFGAKSENLERILALLDRIGGYAVPIAKRVEHKSEVDRPERDAESEPIAVVEDAALPSARRVAAARRLGNVDELTRSRLLVFLAATADPVLRRAIEVAVGQKAAS